MSNKGKSDKKKVCCFCSLSEDNEIQFGKFYEHKNIATHYYCLLLSSNMEQKGNDDEGILGFLADDILKEIRRGKRLVCIYCKKNGATLGCCNIKCKKIFHYPCGLRAGSLHQFFGEFRSYCISHKPVQRAYSDLQHKHEDLGNVICYICYDAVNPVDMIHTLWAPCCKKSAWFHRICVQQLAMSAGYFFKCPLCNNKNEFQNAMLNYGIFIPSQDASWELEPNAFQDLLYRHDRCDAPKCVCPKGRHHKSSNAKWELILCQSCGSQGIHMACGNIKWINRIWECSDCTSILRKSEDSSTSEIAENILQNDSDSDDSDVSVGTETSVFANTDSNPLLPYCESLQFQIKLRPGPRSYKLQQLRTTTKMKKIEIEETNEQDRNTEEDDSDNDSEVQYNEGSTINEEEKSVTSPTNDKANENNVLSEIDNVILIDSDDDIIEIPLHDKMTSLNNILPTCSTAPTKADNLSDPLNYQSQTRKNIDASKNIHLVDLLQVEEPKVNNENTVTTETAVVRKLGSPQTTNEKSNQPDKQNDFPTPVLNIKIINVTSLTPEKFATLTPITESKPDTSTQSNLIDWNLPDTTKLNYCQSSTPSSSQSSAMEKNLKRKSDNSHLTNKVYDVGTAYASTATATESFKKVRPEEVDKNIPSKNPTLNRITLEKNQSHKSNSVLQFLTINSSPITLHENHEADKIVPNQRSSTLNSVSSKTPKQFVRYNDNNNDDSAISFIRLPEMERRNTECVEIEQQNRIPESMTAKKIDTKRKEVLNSATEASIFLSEFIQIPGVTNHGNSRITQNLTPNKEGSHQVERGINAAATNKCDGDAGNRPADQGYAVKIDCRDDRTTDKVERMADDWTDKPEERAAVALYEATEKEENFVLRNNTCNHSRLIPDFIRLQDLKFRVQDSNKLQMILFDQCSINLNLDIGINPANSAPRKKFLGDEKNETCPAVSCENNSQQVFQFTQDLNGLPSLSYVDNRDDCKYENTTNEENRNFAEGAKENLDPTTKIPRSRDTSDNLVPSVSFTENSLTYSTSPIEPANPEPSVCNSPKVLDGEVRNTRHKSNLVNIAQDFDNTNVNKSAQRILLQHDCTHQKNEIFSPRTSANLVSCTLTRAEENRLGSVKPNVQSLRSDHVSSSTIEKYTRESKEPSNLYNSLQLVQCRLESKEFSNWASEKRPSKVGTSIRVSIDLNKVQNFIDANPHLFLKRQKEKDVQCYGKLVLLNKEEDDTEGRRNLQNGNYTKSVRNGSRYIDNVELSSSKDSITLPLSGCMDEIVYEHQTKKRGFKPVVEQSEKQRVFDR